MIKFSLEGCSLALCSKVGSIISRKNLSEGFQVFREKLTKKRSLISENALIKSTKDSINCKQSNLVWNCVVLVRWKKILSEIGKLIDFLLKKDFLSPPRDVRLFFCVMFCAWRSLLCLSRLVECHYSESCSTSPRLFPTPSEPPKVAVEENSANIELHFWIIHENLPILNGVRLSLSLSLSFAVCMERSVRVEKSMRKKCFSLVLHT